MLSIVSFFKSNKAFKLFLLLITLFLCITFESTFACTRILNVDNGQAVLVGRTMDWYQDLKTNLVVYPRGIPRDGMASANALKWLSKYGSIVATAFEGMTTDGMNERGLAAHILWLNETNYGKRDNKLPAMSVALWAQYYLDNFQTVIEAIQFTKKSSFQIESLLYPGTQDPITVHLALEDANGDSAIIEYINGVPRIYHNRDYVVLTNSPPYNQQLKNLKRYKGFGGVKTLPGSTASSDRFVRANYYLSRLPKTRMMSEAIAGVLGVVQNISEPFESASADRLEIEPTLWRTVSDLTHKVYYFNSSNSLNFIWTSLDKFNLESGSPILKLDLLNNPNLAGEISKEFRPVTLRSNRLV